MEPKKLCYIKFFFNFSLVDEILIKIYIIYVVTAVRWTIKPYSI